MNESLENLSKEKNTTQKIHIQRGRFEWKWIWK